MIYKACCLYFLPNVAGHNLIGICSPAILFLLLLFYTGMSLKNHYAVLGVPPSATPDEIKAAFRTLAKKYHPDKAPDNPFSAAHFGEIQQAYEVLSHPGRRAAYDEDRWLRGLSRRTADAIRITPEWILAEATRLQRHMGRVDTYRMDHAALRDYILALLTDEHLSVLFTAPNARGPVIETIIAAAGRLQHPYTEPVARQLMLLAGNDASQVSAVQAWLKERAQDALWDRYRPLIIIGGALLFCALIWWLSAA